MGKHKIKMTDYDDSRDGQAYTGEQPKRGIYPGRLVDVADHTAASSGADGLKWVFEITDGEYKGWRGYSYTNMDSTLWKTQQNVNATYGKKDVTIDTDDDGKKARFIKNAGPVKLRVVTEKDDEGESRANLRTVLPGEKVKPKREDLDDLVGDEDDEDDDD